MDDLSVIESKALAAVQNSTDLDSLAKAVQILRDVTEQRNARAETGRRSETVRFWTAILLPTLAFALTSFTFLYQIHEGKIAAQAQEDSQWRLALEKVTTDAKAAQVSALEMESFFNSPRWQDVSRPVGASLLAGVDDTSIFDLVFADFMDKSVEHRQEEIVVLARALTSRLQNRYVPEWTSATQSASPTRPSRNSWLIPIVITMTTTPRMRARKSWCKRTCGNSTPSSIN